MHSVFIVQRERTELFEYLREHFADEPDVSVILDRRTAERRRSDHRRGPAPPGVDRRAGDRRRTPAAGWTPFGYTLTLACREEASAPA
jgi:hypothetical protein